MSRFQQRLKNHKRAIHPVIATIVLIAVTLVLALVVGAYTFGLFGSHVKTITVTSATLYGTSGATAATLSFTTSDPGTATTISSVMLSGPSFPGTVSMTTTSTTTVSNGISSLTYATSSMVSVGSVYNYVISFENGQSVSGSLKAQ